MQALLILSLLLMVWLNREAVTKCFLHQIREGIWVTGLTSLIGSEAHHFR